jgi:hypothetical protein
VARSQAAIQDDLGRHLTGTEPDLAAYWRFNEGSGQLAFDSSANENHGRLGNNDDPAGDNRDPTVSPTASPLLPNDCNANGVLDECDIADGTSQDCDGDGTPDECEAGVVPCGVLDVKPGGCPNSLNWSSQGFLPVAVARTAHFGVTQIDVSSVRLSRADGVGGEVAPNEGPPGPHSVFADVATPFEGVPCDCHDLIGDGLDDLSMKFRTQAVVAALLLGELESGDEVELVITGILLDGTAFTTGGDCIRIVPTQNTGVRARAAPASQAERPVFGRGMSTGHRP